MASSGSGVAFCNGLIVGRLAARGVKTNGSSTITATAQPGKAAPRVASDGWRAA
jgi:hypothetical protein